MASPQYHSKLCSADVAVQAIKSHNRVFMTGNCSVPKELLGALVRRRRSWKTWRSSRC